MATFITTIKFTPQGVQNIQDSPKRAVAFTTAAKKMGLKILGLYWTLGEFDGAMVYEAPDDKTATAAMLGLASKGNVQTVTVRAFPASEFEKVVALLKKG